MAVTLKKILANSDEHVVIMMQEDTGNENDTVAMGDIGGDASSVIAIEHVQYTLINDKSVDIQFDDGASSQVTQLELYGQGELGGISGTISDNSTAGDRVKVIFETGAKGTILLRLRKVSGF